MSSIKSMAKHEENIEKSLPMKKFFPGKYFFSIINNSKMPFLAILGGLIFGAIIMVLTDRNPLLAYQEMIKGALLGKNFANLAFMINRAIPYIGMGLAAGISLKAGYFNLGGEGQMVLGGLVAALVATNLSLPGPLLIFISIVCAALVGGIYATLAAHLEYKFSVPLLITTLLLNYPANLFASFLVTQTLRDPASSLNETRMIPPEARFGLFIEGTELHSGIFITIFMVLIYAFILHRTVFGYELRMMGLNKRFAKYGGINTFRAGYFVMFVSGAVAGIVGAIEILGVQYRYRDYSLTSPLYAWTGLMTALLSGSEPFGILGAGLFFSTLYTGGLGMERGAGVPREIGRVVQAVIIMLFSAGNGLNSLKKKNKETD